MEHAGPSYARSKKPIETLAPERLVKPSNFVHGLDKHRAQAKNAETMRQLPKSTSWRHEAARVEQPQEYEPEPDTHRDDSLALIEKLEPGPREFKDNLEDPHWEKVEPYSRIRLR
jgi:minichromosome maintenance protein 10